tara:strand:- start:341 stop:1225 length:885 start_codon:yes stop_codon:yes gene_type:complete
MGNTIDWGQAAVNNTIGFGDGAENNTIGWGDIQADSWSPETNLTGTGSTPAFANTYSLLFDEVDTMVSMGDVLDMADDGTDAYSVSVWFKTTSTQSYQQVIGKQVNGGNSNGWNLSIFAAASQSQFRGFLGTGAGSRYLFFQTSYSSDVRSGNWNNVVMTYDGTQSVSGFSVYLNGNAITVTSITNNTPSGVANTSDFNIGVRGNAGSYSNPFDGNIDEASYYTSELSASDVTTIFGTGVPNDITALSPVLWIRCGENGAWNGSKWLLTDQGSGGNDGNGLNMVEANRQADVPT